MKNSVKLILLIVLSALSSLYTTSSYAQEEPKNKGKEQVINDGVVPGKFTQDYDAAMQYASEKGLPVFLNFTGSDWCKWCKIMDKNVFSKPEWKKYAKDNLVQIFIDFPRNKSLVPEKYRNRNQELSQKYGVRGYPTYFVLDSKGNKLGKLGAGSDKTPASFKVELQKLLMMTEEGMKKFCEGLKPEDAEKVMKNFINYREINKAKNKLSEKLKEVKKVTEEKKEALDKSILTGKLNSMSEEERNQYEVAQKAVLKAQNDLNEWIKKNGQSKPTPELSKEFNGLRKALSTAKSKLDNF